MSGAHRVRFNFDQEPGGKLLDVPAIVAATAPDAHLYCCGPAPLLAAFHEATKPLPPTRVHFEYFASASAPAGGGFTVVLARTGEAIAIPDGKSILDTLLERGLDVPHSCTQGVCGSCETRVLDGVPDHKDCVMTDDERKANKTMMICCSGSKSDKLVLDL
jgi:vanillate O-demethylase ferredoxin subunit